MSAVHAFLIFLISLHSTTHALLMCRSGAVFGFSIALCACAVAGTYLYSRLSAFHDSRLRTQLLMAVWVLYAMVLLLTLAQATAVRLDGIQSSVHAVATFQLGFLIFAGGGHGYIGAHRNALVLICLSVLSGGVVASSAILGYVLLMMVWLIADRHLRWGASLASICRAALPLCAPTGAVLIATLVLFPPSTYEPLSRALPAQSTGELLEEYLKLLTWVVAGFTILYLLRRYFDFSGSDQATELEIDLIETVHAGDDSRTRRQGGEHVDPTSFRARIVKLYVEFLRKLEHRGVRHRPDWTPSELAAQLPSPADELARIFARARYGPVELGQRDLDEAGEAAERTLSIIDSPGSENSE